jgi:phosphatidylserine/phosphatidylglycerophosphate/cardiolipin synthase-like enzyme
MIAPWWQTSVNLLCDRWFLTWMEANHAYLEASVRIRRGAEVRRWGSGELHAKFAIADDVWVITGSFNWTQSAATSNVEPVAGIGDADVVARFVELFEDLWDRAGSPRR